MALAVMKDYRTKLVIHVFELVHAISAQPKENCRRGR